MAPAGPAGAHASKAAKDLLREDGVDAFPRRAAGADVSPLCVYVNRRLKDEIRGNGLSNLGKLRDGARTRQTARG